MTEQKPTPEKENPPVAPDKETRQNAEVSISQPERDGFFRRVRRGLNPEPVHPSEAKEIVVMEGEGGDDPSERD